MLFSHYFSLQVTELPFFASKVRLGRAGVEEFYPLGPLNEYERSILLNPNNKKCIMPFF